METNVINIKTLGGIFDSEKDLKNYCNSQYLVIQKANETIRQLEDEIKHLKTLLMSQEGPQLIVSNEQALVEVQIQKLHEVGMKTTLDIDEVKKLESLVKTLHFIKEKTPKKVAPTTIESTADLLKAAKNLPRDEEEKDE